MTDEHAKRGIDFDQPNAARVYDYLIGGKLNYAIDRMFAEQRHRGVDEVRTGLFSRHTPEPGSGG